jgi:energy-coupling factor transporter ATP-binding protein EcfA2
MIRTIFAKNCTAVPYLETSQLMQSHPDGIAFSTDKPNVLVGPNGIGKSALMTAMAKLTFSYQTGVSALDNNYLETMLEPALWTRRRAGWDEVVEFMAGLVVDTDFAPAAYYRPWHIPGNDEMVTAAMQCGYFKEAKAYARLVEKRSSGQGCSALLKRVFDVLDGDVSTLQQYIQQNWSYGLKPVDLTKQRGVADYQYFVEEMKKRATLPEQFLPVLLLDEPEQSLDARSALEFWRKVAAVDTSKVQVIAATHSLYPLLHPEQFNIVEATLGYADSVRALM